MTWYKWTGAVSTDWNNESNWLKWNGYSWVTTLSRPISGDDVIIPKGTNYCALGDNYSLNSIYVGYTCSGDPTIDSNIVKDTNWQSGEEVFYTSIYLLTIRSLAKFYGKTWCSTSSTHSISIGDATYTATAYIESGAELLYHIITVESPVGGTSKLLFKQGTSYWNNVRITPKQNSYIGGYQLYSMFKGHVIHDLSGGTIEFDLTNANSDSTATVDLSYINVKNHKNYIYPQHGANVIMKDNEFLSSGSRTYLDLDVGKSLILQTQMNGSFDYYDPKNTLKDTWAYNKSYSVLQRNTSESNMIPYSCSNLTVSDGTYSLLDIDENFGERDNYIIRNYDRIFNNLKPQTVFKTGFNVYSSNGLPQRYVIDNGVPALSIMCYTQVYYVGLETNYLFNYKTYNTGFDSFRIELDYRIKGASTNNPYQIYILYSQSGVGKSYISHTNSRERTTFTYTNTWSLGDYILLILRNRLDSSLPLYYDSELLIYDLKFIGIDSSGNETVLYRHPVAFNKWLTITPERLDKNFFSLNYASDPPTYFTGLIATYRTLLLDMKTKIKKGGASFTLVSDYDKTRESPNIRDDGVGVVLNYDIENENGYILMYVDNVRTSGNWRLYLYKLTNGNYSSMTPIAHATINKDYDDYDKIVALFSEDFSGNKFKVYVEGSEVSLTIDDSNEMENPEYTEGYYGLYFHNRYNAVMFGETFNYDYYAENKEFYMQSGHASFKLVLEANQDTIIHFKNVKVTSSSSDYKDYIISSNENSEIIFDNVYKTDDKDMDFVIPIKGKINFKNINLQNIKQRFYLEDLSVTNKSNVELNITETPRMPRYYSHKIYQGIPKKEYVEKTPKSISFSFIVDEEDDRDFISSFNKILDDENYGKVMMYFDSKNFLRGYLTNVRITRLSPRTLEYSITMEE